jgi:two-component system phosphate regulon sensor histidine kinase PhoR
LAPRIFFKIILALLVVLGLTLAAVELISHRAIASSYTTEARRTLSEKARMFALLTTAEQVQTVRQQANAAQARVTVTDANGKVLADSGPGPDPLADTLTVEAPSGNNSVRASLPLSGIHAELSRIRRQTMISVAIAFLPALALAAWFARYFSRRLAAIIEHTDKLSAGDFHARLDQSALGGELSILGEKLNDTGEKLEKMFQELQREQNEMEKLERIRKDFVINVSHELRTPLASIQGYTDTLLDGALHDPQNNVHFLTIIKQNAERLGRLTADLLTLSRIELKTQKFQFAGYYINVLLRQNVESMQPMADKKDVEIILEPAPPEAEVFCDSEAVHQILSNLMDNALKYTPKEGKIYVGARVVEGALLEKVEIYVRDTGIGIPAQELPRLFERFYRVDKARSRELGGTGLGLAIVKHLARAQGGEVRVESVINQGSTFMFTLPVHDLGLQETGAVQTELTHS